MYVPQKKRDSRAHQLEGFSPTHRERRNESSTVQICAHTKAYKCTVINDHISKHVWTKGCSCSLLVTPAQLMRSGTVGPVLIA